MLGTASGIMTKCCNYPLLNWKNATQQGLPISFSPPVVYRGLFMACLNLGGTTAVQFWSVGVFQKLIAGKEKINSTQQITAAFCGGMMSGIPCSLWELTMIQQQRFGGSIIGAPQRIVAAHGISVLGRGTIMTMGRESLFTMAMLGATPVMQRELIERFKMDPSVGLAVGSLLGAFFSATVTHPMDTIKTCMQGDVEQKKYTNIRGTGASLVQENGVKGLFKGLSWRIALIATTFFLVNKFKEGLAPVMFPEPTEEKKK
eukprot:2710813-Rhodomonas_salina.1